MALKLIICSGTTALRAKANIQIIMATLKNKNIIIICEFKNYIQLYTFDITLFYISNPNRLPREKASLTLIGSPHKILLFKDHMNVIA